MPNCRWQEQVPEGSWLMEENAGRRLELRFAKAGILSGNISSADWQEGSWRRKLEPVTVNVKLNYRGIMMRQRGRGKMKASLYSSGSKAGEDGNLQRVWKSGIRVKDPKKSAQGRDKVQQQVERCRSELEESCIFVCFCWRKRRKQKMREAEVAQYFVLFLQGMWGRDKESIFRQSGDEEWRGAQGLLKNWKSVINLLG